MWWRFLVFCVLVSLVLFIVLSCIHGRPAIHLFFHRCCEEDIENDQVIFENFGNNFLREKLVGADLVVDDNESFASEFDVDEVMKAMREKLHDSQATIDLQLDNDTSIEVGGKKYEKNLVSNTEISTELIADYDSDSNEFYTSKDRSRERTTPPSINDITDKSNNSSYKDLTTVNNKSEKFLSGIPIYQSKIRDKKFRNKYTDLNQQDESDPKPSEHKKTQEVRGKNYRTIDRDDLTNHQSGYNMKVLKAMQEIINVHNLNSRERLLSMTSELEKEILDKDDRLVTDIDFDVTAFTTDYPIIDEGRDYRSSNKKEIDKDDLKDDENIPTEIPIEILKVNLFETTTLNSMTDATSKATVDSDKRSR